MIQADIKDHEQAVKQNIHYNDMTRAIILLTLACLIGACSRYDAVRIARAAATGSPAAAAEALARDKAIGYATNPAAIGNDLKNFKKLLEAFAKAVTGVWGEDDARLPAPKQYVKYTDNYLSRASVDFDTGVIVVETVAEKEPLKSLRNAIVTTLLTPGDPRAVDLYSARTVKLGDTPFLLGEVKDADGKNIRWEWRAGRYADHLIANDLKTRTVKGRTARYVTFRMVRDHLSVRAAKYRELVRKTADRFQVSRNLVYAIMKVESDFNPFAVSSASAVGLMQVVPSTAGSDVYRFLHGKAGQPSRKALFEPPTNIAYGTAYLHLLDSRFLGGIQNPVSREYCVIAGYNGGAGGVLKAFDGDKGRAAGKINAMQPAEVYETLRKKLPFAETRRYLGKVLEAKKQFVNF
jgi:membrane-bound lytic murein transglycosylase C